MTEAKKPRQLHVVLNEASTAAFDSISAKLKETAPYVRLQPSHFVSFLVSDYLACHFESEMDILIAEFFDFDAFYEHARKAAKGKPNFVELMADALIQAQRIKKKGRRKPAPEKSTAGDAA